MRAKYTYVTAIFSLCGLFACSHDKEEAGALIHAVEVYRGASDANKVAAVEKLRAVPCTLADVCAAKDECMQMAEPTANALKVKLEAVQILAAAKTDAAAAPDVAALPDRLDGASKLLDLGHDHLGACEEKVAGLRIKYRL